MNYKEKTKEPLINESAELHQRIEDLKAIETKHKRAELSEPISKFVFTQNCHSRSPRRIRPSADKRSAPACPVGRSGILHLPYPLLGKEGKKGRSGQADNVSFVDRRRRIFMRDNNK